MIYAEEKASREQLGYLHMVAEANLLQLYGELLRKNVRKLKRQDINTEPAFVEVLGLKGDPYLALLPFTLIFLGGTLNGEKRFFKLLKGI